MQRLWAATGRQLRHPSGQMGRILGQVMGSLNAKPNRLAIDALDIQRRDTVLELGFGPGRSLRHMASLAPEGMIRALDHSPDMLTLAQAANRDIVATGQLELRQGSFSALPWPDKTFERILLVNVVYFFDLEGRDIAEVYRVLKYGGRISIYATARTTMSNWPFCEPDTHRTFGRDDLTNMLLQGGFHRRDIIHHPVRLPLGIHGWVVTADKAAV